MLRFFIIFYLYCGTLRCVLENFEMRKIPVILLLSVIAGQFPSRSEAEARIPETSYGNIDSGPLRLNDQALLKSSSAMGHGMSRSRSRSRSRGRPRPLPSSQSSSSFGHFSQRNFQSPVSQQQAQAQPRPSFPYPKGHAEKQRRGKGHKTRSSMGESKNIDQAMKKYKAILRQRERKAKKEEFGIANQLKQYEAKLRNQDEEALTGLSKVRKRGIQGQEGRVKPIFPGQEEEEPINFKMGQVETPKKVKNGRKMKKMLGSKVARRKGKGKGHLKKKVRKGKGQSQGQKVRHYQAPKKWDNDEKDDKTEQPKSEQGQKEVNLERLYANDKANANNTNETVSFVVTVKPAAETATKGPEGEQGHSPTPSS